jgi:hypothetical protein
MEEYTHPLLNDEPRSTVDFPNPFTQIELSLSITAGKEIFVALH